MAYDEGLAERIRDFFMESGETPFEKKMFGGLCFMINGHMCIGIAKQEKLMLRVGPDAYENILSKPHANEMDFTGKPLKGFIYVDEEGFSADDDLAKWCRYALDFVKTLEPK